MMRHKHTGIQFEVAILVLSWVTQKLLHQTANQWRRESIDCGVVSSIYEVDICQKLVLWISEEN